MSAVKEMALTERTERALTPADQLVVTVKALAENPNVDVDKLERIIGLQNQLLADQARQAFNAAFTRAQQAMRPVVEDATNPQTRSRYASYEALERALRPIYTEHGFGMSFGTADVEKPETIRVTCEVAHVGGHAKTYHLDMPADGKGAKGGDVMTKTHAVGSVLSYGQRYLLKLIWNVSTADRDDDGNAAGGRQTPEPPDGYADWFTDMQAFAQAATLGELQAQWQKSSKAFRDYTHQHNSAAWASVKAAARKNDA